MSTGTPRQTRRPSAEAPCFPGHFFPPEEKVLLSEHLLYTRHCARCLLIHVSSSCKEQLPPDPHLCFINEELGSGSRREEEAGGRVQNPLDCLLSLDQELRLQGRRLFQELLIWQLLIHTSKPRESC